MSRIQQREGEPAALSTLAQVLTVVGSVLLAASVACMIAVWLGARVWQTSGPLLEALALASVIAFPLAVIALVGDGVIRVIRARRATRR